MNEGYWPIITMSCHATITLNTNSTIAPARSRGTYLRGIGTSPNGLRIRITRLDLDETAMLASLKEKSPKVDYLRGEAHGYHSPHVCRSKTPKPITAASGQIDQHARVKTA
jgi:hypothetical protein